MLRVQQKMEGKVVFNDGDFAEIAVAGVEGEEAGLFLTTMQAHREDTSDTNEQFRQRFGVGTILDILVITHFANNASSGAGQRHSLAAIGLNDREIRGRGCTRQWDFSMTVDEKRSEVRRLLEVAVGLVRQSWDAISELESTVANDLPFDVHAYVNILATTPNEERIPENAIAELLGLAPHFRFRKSPPHSVN